MLVDAHTHVACGDDPRFPTRPTGVASDWWRHGGTVDELIAELDAAGVDHCVVVQAIGAYAHECGCAAHSVAEHPGRLALVASIDMDSGDPAATLAVLNDVLDVTPAGIRLFGAGARRSRCGSSDGRAADVWDVAAELGTTLVPCLFTTPPARPGRGHRGAPRGAGGHRPLRLPRHG